MKSLLRALYNALFRASYSASDCRSLQERMVTLTNDYDKMFAEREEARLLNPLIFHLHHLALYWNRCVGFSQHKAGNAKWVLDSDFGVCIRIASPHVASLVHQDSPIYATWCAYYEKEKWMMQAPQITEADVREGARLLGECLKLLNHDPWNRANTVIVP